MTNKINATLQLLVVGLNLTVVMKNILPFVLLITLSLSCDFEHEVGPLPHLPESTTQVQDKAVIKVLPYAQGFISLQETLQPQYLVTQPKRELIWLSTDLQVLSSFTPPATWSLIDAAVHPSGEVSAALINLDITRSHLLEIKVLRFRLDGSIIELLLEPLPVAGERTRYFPASLDRIRLEAYHEDLYVVARWEYNEVEAFRIGFSNGNYMVKWQTQVEPDAYAGSIGIIGGGYDNFHQGDRYFFVYTGVDTQGNLYVVVPSHEDLLTSHDAKFNDNLLADADPGTYDWGVAILTKLSPTGERKYSKLHGRLTNKRLINFRVGEGSLYFIGRVKTGSEPDSWDAWLLTADAATGIKKQESQIDFNGGDMFWDVSPLSDGGAVAVGSTGYVQNPGGLSVSDARQAMALVIDGHGKATREIVLPQGPPERGSEAMFIRFGGKNSMIIGGVHNAPGTHAEVYCDGFIAVRDFVLE
jgi:hypothetical protein